MQDNPTHILVLLALLNGAILGLNRLTVSRVAMAHGAMKASFWNHVVGFLFLLIVIASFYDFRFLSQLTNPPAYAYLGGVLGACVVALLSWFTPKIGMVKSTLYIMSGQIITGSIIDLALGKITSFPVQTLGICLIILGIAYPRLLATRSIFRENLLKPGSN